MDAVASVVRARHPRVAVQGDASGPHPWLLLTNEAPPEAARLMFACHVDTVPPGDLANWQFDPFAADIDNGLLLGRGTSDMKAGVVAAAAAVIGAVEHGIPVALLLTSDEEIGSLGARAARAAVSVAQHQLEGAVQDRRRGAVAAHSLAAAAAASTAAVASAGPLSPTVAMTSPVAGSITGNSVTAPLRSPATGGAVSSVPSLRSVTG